MLIVTTDGLAGYEIRNVLGEAFGVAVQTDQGPHSAPSATSSTFRMPGGDQPVAGGSGLAAVRRQAVERLGEEARRKGANAVVGMCFDSAALAGGGHEVCAYGTAVWAEAAQTQAVSGNSGAIPQAKQQPEQGPPPYTEPQPGGPPMAARNLTMGL